MKEKNNKSKDREVWRKFAFKGSHQSQLGSRGRRIRPVKSCKRRYMIAFSAECGFRAVKLRDEGIKVAVSM